MNDTTNTVDRIDTLVSVNMLNNYLVKDEDTNQWRINPAIDPSEYNDSGVKPAIPIYNSPLTRLLVRQPEQDGPTIGAIILEAARANARANSHLNLYKTVCEQFTKALSLIGEKGAAASERYDWCAAYDEVIDEINEALPSEFQIPTREKEFELTASITVTLTMDCSASVTAKSFEDAVDALKDDFDGYVDVMQQMRDNHYSVNIEDVEVDEVELA